ncbi:hypothetical protein KIT90_27715 [Vibrio sp. B172a]|uniref:hypothetical protein n=1 Tax=Vibrio sp. B172a TaxID=2835790 RepID=UPI0025573294|nr:hypothetical protein [Vibrio sp. B172a]MDK9785156.1 hypothetical protein [Vibrio sp. B172a]
MNKSIVSEIISNSRTQILISKNFLYFSNLEMDFNLRDFNSIFENNIVILKSNNYVSYGEGLIENKTNHGIFSFSGDLDVKIERLDKVIVVNLGVFSEIIDINAIKGFISNEHINTVTELFDKISSPSENIYEILAIANIFAIDLINKRI